MTLTRSLYYLAVILLLPLIPMQSQDDSPLAPLFENLGDHSHPVTTEDTLAQKYFNQGLILHYGFNHAEAVRSFREAQRLDPECAMAYWGEALSLGPNINAGMSRAAVGVAWEAIGQAQSLAEKASKEEQDYINALAQRYSQQGTNRSSLDKAYADAMRVLAEKYPDDPDAQALFAEALMVTTPWDYWRADGSPKAVTREITSTLEASMEKQPRHPGTNHFYMHTVETRHPERGIAAADRMRDLVPDAGHLQHMPSHIYIQIGRYADASIANEKAVAADREYLDRYGAHGMYRISYMPHNSIYLCFTTMMEGRSHGCLEAANTTRDLILKDQLFQPGYGSLTQGYSLRYVAMARFGMWEKMLAEPKPDVELLFPTAIWHYARGMALLRSNRNRNARNELESLTALTADDKIGQMDFRGESTTRAVLQIATNMLAGEIAAAAGNYEEAEARLQDAVRLEDGLGYYEPPVWFHPPRQSLGAILLEADKAAEAENVFRQELEQFPQNGWSLYGLYLSLKAQGEDSEAEEVHSRFEEAWSQADVELSSSRM